MDFASRIHVTCFAACYALALVGEVLRLRLPERWPRYLATTAAVVGWLTQTMFLWNIAVSTGRLPIAGRFPSLIFVSWLLALIYVYLLLADRRSAAGFFILPMLLGLQLYAAAWTDRALPAELRGNPIVRTAHGLLLLVGTVFVLVATAVGLMYLVKVRQIRAGTHTGRFRLPSLEWLDRVNTASVYLAWPTLTIGLLLGLSLRGLAWSDPKVLTTAAAWLAFTVVAHMRARPENRGRRMALATLGACAFVIISLLGDTVLGSGHLRPASGETVESTAAGGPT